MNWRTRVKINCSPFLDRSPSVLILGYYRDDRSWDRSLDPCAVFVRIENLIFAGPGGTRTCAPVRLWVKFWISWIGSMGMAARSRKLHLS